jgi:hypothetical protein
METNMPKLKDSRKQLYIAAALLALFIGASAVLGGLRFEWYREPYSHYGKTIAWAFGMPEAAYNFAVVTPAKLYRSGLPDAKFLAYVRRRYDIKYIVSLIGPLEIHRTARNLGMEVTVLDWRTAAPTTQELRALLSFLNEKTGVLIHCHAGRDRTGYVVALHRMQQQHWSLERALGEMEAHGHSLSRRTQTIQLLRYWDQRINSAIEPVTGL